MKKTLFDCVIDQWRTVPPVESADLTGKTVVVVGANIGIGFEAAKHFARMNPAKLVLACRNEGRGAAAVSGEPSKLKSATGFDTCEAWQVDLADFSSTTRFADKFQRECVRLDLLVMNAAVLPQEYEETVDGWESGLQVNYLGTALLSLLLLARLVDTGKKFGSTSRLVIVSSDIHYWDTFLSDDAARTSHPIAMLSGPDYRDAKSIRHRYTATKALNVFFARALQDRLQSITPLTVNAVNPGYCYSNLRSSMRSTFEKMAHAVLEVCLARTSEQGGRQLVYAAIGERDNEDHMKGAYVSLAEVVEPSDFMVDENGKETRDHLWRETIEILTKEAPQVQSIVQEYLI